MEPLFTMLIIVGFSLVMQYICQFIACRNHKLFRVDCSYCMHVTLQSSDFHQSEPLHDPIDNSCVRFSTHRCFPSACHILIEEEQEWPFRQLMFPNSELRLPLTNQTLSISAAISAPTLEEDADSANKGQNLTLC